MNLTSTTYRPPCPKMAEVASSLLLSSLIRTETKDAALPRLSSYIIPPIGQHVSTWMEKHLSKRYATSANEICSSASKRCGSRCDLQRILCSLFAFLQLDFSIPIVLSSRSVFFLHCSRSVSHCRHSWHVCKLQDSGCIGRTSLPHARWRKVPRFCQIP